jgi:hypothetical protein
MLTNLEYAGHTVNFKTYRESFKDKKAKKNSPENREVFRDTHEPIIEQSVFDRVQEMTEQRESQALEKSVLPKEIRPLAELMFCKDCSAKMYHYRNARTVGGGCFACSTNKYTGNQAAGMTDKKCSPHTIKVSDISELVLDSIKRICLYVSKNPYDFISRCYENTSYKQTERVNALEKEIARNKRRLTELRRIFRCLYEEKALGKIEDSRYESVLTEYRNEQADLERTCANLQTELDTFTVNTWDVGLFTKLAEKYANVSELTPTLVSEFVSKVVVHERVKTSSQNVHRVDIHFNLIGDFKIPEISDNGEIIETPTA